MNKKIVVAVAVIAGIGVIDAAHNQKPVTPIILGSYIFLLVMAVLDMFGPPMSTLAGALAMLALVYVLLSHADLFKQLTDIAQNPPTGAPAGGGAGSDFPTQLPKNIQQIGGTGVA